MADDALLEKIEHYLTNEAEQISADEIAKEYLKMPPSPVSNKLVDTMLGKSPRFAKDEQGLWTLCELDSDLISDTLFYAVYVIHSNDNQLLSLSVHEIITNEVNHKLTIKNSDLPQNPVDEPNAVAFNSLGEALATFTRLTIGAPLVFFSYHQQRILQKYLQNYGLSLSDSASVLSSFFRLAEIPFSSPQKGINGMSQTFLQSTYEAVNATEKGVLLAQLFQYSIQKFSEQGTITIDALTQAEQEKIYTTSWPKAQFSVNDIVALNETPGVYGFKDAEDSFIYVGKGNNLRRRMLSYFRQSDESPQKLLTLREQAVQFITHPCGSDLEALLVENRLIQKYKPTLNTHIQHHGTIPQLHSMIILLPSSEEGFLQSLWYGPGSLITLKKLPKYWDQAPPISTDDLQRFFFETPSEEPSQEKIICSRNLSVRENDYDRIAVDSCESVTALQRLLQEACESADGTGSLFR